MAGASQLGMHQDGEWKQLSIIGKTALGPPPALLAPNTSLERGTGAAAVSEGAQFTAAMPGALL